MTQAFNSWLGVAIDFNKVEDKESGNEFEILPQGMYKATIKNAVMGVIGVNNKPALTVHFELEDTKTEISANYFLPEPNDKIETRTFKEECIKNILSRAVYSHLTKEEYNQTDKSIKTKSINELFGKKVQVKILQEPFISQDQNKAYKLTNVSLSGIRKDMNPTIEKLIADTQKTKNIVFDKLPVILFSNKVAARGIGFYNDYEEKERKNSRAFEWYEKAKNITAAEESNEVVVY